MSIEPGINLEFIRVEDKPFEIGIELIEKRWDIDLPGIHIFSIRFPFGCGHHWVVIVFEQKIFFVPEMHKNIKVLFCWGKFLARFPRVLDIRNQII